MSEDHFKRVICLADPVSQVIEALRAEFEITRHQEQLPSTFEWAHFGSRFSVFDARFGPDQQEAILPEQIPPTAKTVIAVRNTHKDYEKLVQMIPESFSVVLDNLDPAGNPA